MSRQSYSDLGSLDNCDPDLDDSGTAVMNEYMLLLGKLDDSVKSVEYSVQLYSRPSRSKVPLLFLRVVLTFVSPLRRQHLH
jgi:hypothetical protein